MKYLFVFFSAALLVGCHRSSVSSNEVQKTVPSRSQTASLGSPDLKTASDTNLFEVGLTLSTTTEDDEPAESLFQTEGNLSEQEGDALNQAGNLFEVSELPPGVRKPNPAAGGF